MADATSILSLCVSAVAVGIAVRSDRRSTRADRDRQQDRAAHPALGVEIEPSNVKPDDDGVIRTENTTVNLTLAIKVANSGTKPATRTHVQAWVPMFVDSTTLKWTDPAGRENDRWGLSANDPAVRLDSGAGREFDTRRMERTLDVVPLVGETIYLRVPCQVPPRGGESMIPVRVRARTDGSEADETYPIRLLNTKPAP